ncbi:ABC transporter permease [Hyphomonas sp. FCG-A18]|uniref:ABC transporter permease n=1 Tax=Hyphomonas sp. FCG-A18 TaxID=3080019 RepID=UPI002B309C16|nr:ABC transporter permease [Hyphomonas sp. FCG-A18]
MGVSILSLAWRSLMNRKVSAILTIVAIALSVALFLGVDKTRKAARAGFDNTISGTDLIVGAPSGQINLLLYSVFRIGNATAEISWDAFEDLQAREDIAWAVPISLGDSHRGYRVMGTSTAYFDHYKYGKQQSLTLREGERFDDVFDAVIGAEVARELNYSVGTPLVLTHGLGQGGLSDHDNRPFRVVGVLAPTGTPVDRTIHVPVEGITAIHVGWETGARNPLADTISEEMIRTFDLTPKTVTAAYIGLKSRGSILRTRRAINTNRSEPLLAIIPGQALSELWETVGAVERILLAISAFVVAVGLVSILTSILSSLNERRREMSILRATGAKPGHIFTLLVAEAVFLGLIGAIAGVVLVQGLIFAAAPVLSAQYGIALMGTAPGLTDAITIGVVGLAAFLLGIMPALTALRRSLADGLTVRV